MGMKKTMLKSCILEQWSLESYSASVTGPLRTEQNATGINMHRSQAFQRSDPFGGKAVITNLKAVSLSARNLLDKTEPHRKSTHKFMQGSSFGNLAFGHVMRLRSFCCAYLFSGCWKPAFGSCWEISWKHQRFFSDLFRKLRERFSNHLWSSLIV